jgi:DNA phosphorothioation-associated putative methyltransferase
MILTARQIVGDVEYDLIKIGLDGKKLSFLRYPDFEGIAHPDLAYSIRVYLPTASYGIKNFSNSENPPILHRKESFLDSLHPRYAEFALHSAQEEELGLLSRSDIGTRNRWEALLKESHVDIVGHTLIRISEDDTSEVQSYGPVRTVV